MNAVVHEIEIKGETKYGFDEEKFPFLWPPNEGSGYYQSGQID
ncbi:MAG: hypothetical protein R3B45_12735 [Bdellovibrionota bacterium]